MTNIQKMNNSYDSTNERQYPEMYQSYSPQYQGNYVPLNVVPPEYIAPDYVAVDMNMPAPPSYQDATGDIHSECRRKEEILANAHKRRLEIIKTNHQQEINTIQKNSKGNFFGGMLFAGLLVGIGVLIYRLVTMY